MKFKIGVIIAVFTSLFTACLEDDTNYDYKEVVLPGNLVVKNLSSNRTDLFTPSSSIVYIMNSGNELCLQVDSVDYTGDDELEFEWRLEGEVIGRGKTLTFRCLKGGVGYLYVFRKKAQNATAYQFRLKVSDLFSAGIVVLAQHNGKIQLDWIERQEREENVELAEQVYEGFKRIYYNEYSDIYEIYNNDETLDMEEPLKIEDGENISQNYFDYQFVCKDWQNSVAVNALTMRKIVSLKDEFVEVPGNLKIKDFVNIGKISMILDESGKIYMRSNYDNGTPHTGRFSSIPLSVIVDGEVQEVKADMISAKKYRSAALIYEKDKKRFLGMSVPKSINDNPDYAPLFTLESPKNAKEAAKMPYYVNLNNFDKEVVAILWEGTIYESYQPAIYIVFKDAEGTYIQKIVLKYQRYPSKVWMKELTIKSAVCLPVQVAEALREGGYKMQIVNQKNNDILYFAKGCNVWSMPMDGSEMKAELAFQNEAPISKFIVTDTWKGVGYNIWERYFNGRVMAIAFEDGTFKVVKIYDDPYNPLRLNYSLWVNKKYTGGVIDMKYLNRMAL